MISPSNNAGDRLWKCFKNAFYTNKKGQDGRIRILSIIANEYTHDELKEELDVRIIYFGIKMYRTYNTNLIYIQISSKTISSARSYATVNGPGCPTLCKPTITRVRLAEESLDQLTAFLLDKNIATPSSYKVDAATGLSVMYLKDTKESLWRQFFELHPNGMKRTAFITRLKNSRFIYRDDSVMTLVDYA